MLLNSVAFTHEGEIPFEFTCDSKNINPPLSIRYVPQDAKSLVLIVEDPDSPTGLWIHWMIWNIPVTTAEICKGETPKGVVGKNSRGEIGWDGICPPDGEHKYVFKVLALDTELELDPETTTLESLNEAMKEHILKQEVIKGTYARQNQEQ